MDTLPEQIIGGQDHRKSVLCDYTSFTIFQQHYPIYCYEIISYGFLKGNHNAPGRNVSQAIILQGAFFEPAQRKQKNWDPSQSL